MIIVLSIFLMLSVLFNGCNFLTEPAPKPEYKKVAAGVSLDGIDLSGRNSLEAENLLRNRVVSGNDVAPENARFDDATGQITGEKSGKMVDVAATLELVLAAAANSQLTARYKEILPQVTADDLHRSQEIGSFTTPVLDDSPGRLDNIRLTVQLINNYILEPGQEFSFNRVTGEPTAERGFKNAAILTAGGEKTQGLGGGMCQVSSTLYNAVLAANLAVTERHPHSRPVEYVPAGKDATTFTDKDFRFINNTRFRLIIRALTNKNEVNIQLRALSKR